MVLGRISTVDYIRHPLLAGISLDNTLGIRYRAGDVVPGANDGHGPKQVSGVSRPNIVCHLCPL